MACRKARRTLCHRSAGGPEHHNLIHGATMQPCRTDRHSLRSSFLRHHEEESFGNLMGVMIGGLDDIHLVLKPNAVTLEKSLPYRLNEGEQLARRGAAIVHHDQGVLRP